MRIYLLFLMFILPVALAAQLDVTLESSRKMALEYSRQAAMASKGGEKMAFERKALFSNFLPKISATGLFYYSPNAIEQSIQGGYLPTFVPGADGALVPNVMVDPTTGRPVVGADGNPVFNQYAFLPDIDLSLGFEGVTKGDVVLEQPLYMGGKIRSAYRMAQLGEAMAAENVRLQRQNVVADVDQAFWIMAEVTEKLKVVDQLVALLNEVKKQVVDGVETGMKTRNDQLKVQVKLNEALLNQQKARNGVELARMNLCRIIGLPLTAQLNLVDSLPAAGDSTILFLGSTPELRPELAILEKDVALKGQNIRLIRSDYLPQVGAMASYGYLGGLSFNGGDINQWSFSAMGSVKIPVFHWGEGRNKVRVARLEHEMGQLKLEEASQLMTLEVAKARFNLLDATTRVEMARQALQQADENVRMSDDRYSLGLEPVSGLLDAQTQWQQVWYEMIEARLQLRMAETIYLKSLGRLEVGL